MIVWTRAYSSFGMHVVPLKLRMLLHHWIGSKPNLVPREAEHEELHNFRYFRRYIAAGCNVLGRSAFTTLRHWCQSSVDLLRSNTKIHPALWLL